MTNGDTIRAKMDGDGHIGLSICNENSENCCSTGWLDNPDKDDFEVGAFDTFQSQNMILGCDKFVAEEISNVKVSQFISI